MGQLPARSLSLSAIDQSATKHFDAGFEPSGGPKAAGELISGAPNVGVDHKPRTMLDEVRALPRADAARRPSIQ